MCTIKTKSIVLGTVFYCINVTQFTIYNEQTNMEENKVYYEK